METLKQLLMYGIDAGIQLLTRPFYYISILFVMLFYRRQVLVERKLFHVKCIPGVADMANVSGRVAGRNQRVRRCGLPRDILKPGSHYMHMGDFLILMLFHIRYLCFAYSIGLLGIIQFGLGWFRIGDRKAGSVM